MRFLQTNLNHSRAAQDLVRQSAHEMRTDVCVISEPHAGLIKDAPGWFLDRSGTAAIGVMDRGLTVADIEAGDGFVAARIGGIDVMSCYASPNHPIAPVLEGVAMCLRGRRSTRPRGSRGEIVAGDFNAKSPVWGSDRTDQRGEDLLDLMSALGLLTANTGATPTFEGNTSSSVVDVTLASPSTLRHVTGWSVLPLRENMSDHRYIVYDFVDGGRPRRGDPSREPGVGRVGWRVGPDVDVDAFETGLLLSQWSAPAPPNRPVSASEAAEELDRRVVAACEFALPAKRPPCTRGPPVHWWNAEVAAVREECVRARRALTRSNRRPRGPDDGPDPDPRGALREARKRLKLAIRRSKAACWAELVKSVDHDPWGKPYRAVMRKLRGPPASGQLEADVLERTVETLFPTHPPLPPPDYGEGLRVEEFTSQEVSDAVARVRGRNTAPGPDAVPNRVWGLVNDLAPEWIRAVVNRCLLDGEFPRVWKRARLVLLRKGDKPEGVPSSYRPLCMLDDVGKILERLLVTRLEQHLEDAGGLADGQFGFRRGRSTDDAACLFRSLAVRAENQQGFGVAVSLDIRNAFNSVRWSHILGALDEFRVPPYLGRMIRSYFSDRVIAYASAAGPRTRTVTGGVPQGSVLGPLLWNIAYNAVFHVPLPPHVRVICYADDTLVVAEGGSTEVVGRRMNAALAAVTGWIQREGSGLSLALDKTEAVLFTGRYRFTPPRLAVLGVEIPLKDTMTYLGLVIDKRLMFGPHIVRAAQRAQKVMDSLAGLMPNTGGPREMRRRLLVSVVHSVLLYGSPVWASTLEYSPRNREALLRVQRRAAIRTVSAYRTVSGVTAGILSSLPPADLLAEERATGHEIRRERGQPLDAEDRLVLRRTTVLRWRARLSEESRGEWVRSLIGPDRLAGWLDRTHGEMTYRLTQVMSGHGCFNEYLHGIRRAAAPTCDHCQNRPGEADSALHTLFRCDAWAQEREQLESRLGSTFGVGTMVDLMLRSREGWGHVQAFVEAVMTRKESAERLRQRAPPRRLQQDLRRWFQTVS